MSIEKLWRTYCKVSLYPSCRKPDPLNHPFLSCEMRYFEFRPASWMLYKTSFEWVVGCGGDTESVTWIVSNWYQWQSNVMRIDLDKNVWDTHTNLTHLWFCTPNTIQQLGTSDLPTQNISGRSQFLTTIAIGKSSPCSFFKALLSCYLGQRKPAWKHVHLTW